MLNSSYEGINILKDNILYVILGISGVLNIGVIFYETMTLLMLSGCTGTEYTIKGNSTDFIDGNKTYLVRFA